MDDGRVVMIGKLRAELDSALRRTYGAVPIDDLSADAAARAIVAVTSGVWGVRCEHLYRLPGLGAVVNFGVGYDSTDVSEATRRGVIVSNTPGRAHGLRRRHRSRPGDRRDASAVGRRPAIVRVAPERPLRWLVGSAGLLLALWLATG